MKREITKEKGVKFKRAPGYSELPKNPFVTESEASANKLAEHIEGSEEEFEKMVLNPKPFTSREVKNLPRR